MTTPAAQICSADHYFLNDKGEYVFDATKLPAAHAACLRKFVDLVAQKGAGSVGYRVTILRGIPGSGKSTFVANNPDLGIVVDNTCTTLAETAPYAALALACGMPLEIVNFQCDYKVAAARNQHGVPLESCKRMADRMAKSDAQEMWPGWWKQRTVQTDK